LIESDSLISKGSRHLVREVGAERKEELVKFLVEILCGPPARTSSNIAMPLSA